MEPWEELARRQFGMMARRQLRARGVHRHRVRDRIAAGHWVARSDLVVSSFTGPMLPAHRMWLGVLHAGGRSLVGGLTAAAVHGLKGWERDGVVVIVDHPRIVEPLPGIRFVRTRRSLKPMRDPSSVIPLCRIEPAILLFAAYTASEAGALGAVAATVQQRLTTAARLREWVAFLRPLPRSRKIRDLLDDIEAGADSWHEARFGRLCDRFGVMRPRRQTPHRDAAGRARRTDCEWDLPTGVTVVLEIDGPFHMNVLAWSEDLARQRDLTDLRRPVIRCSTVELRQDPGRVFDALRRLGVPGRAR